MTKKGKIINLHTVPNNIIARLQWYKTLKDSLTLDFILGGHVKSLVWVFLCIEEEAMPLPVFYYVKCICNCSFHCRSFNLITISSVLCRWFKAMFRLSEFYHFFKMLPSNFSSINWTPVWSPAKPGADTLPMKIMPTGKKLSHFPTVIVFYTNTTYVI